MLLNGAKAASPKPLEGRPSPNGNSRLPPSPLGVGTDASLKPKGLHSVSQNLACHHVDPSIPMPSLHCEEARVKAITGIPIYLLLDTYACASSRTRLM